MFKILCLAALLSIAAAGKVKFIDCGHHEVISLDVTNCQGDYCIIHKGTHVDIDAVMKAPAASNKLTLSLIANINGLDMEVPGFEHDGCKYVQCPIVKDKTYDVKYGLDVPKILPNIKANITAKVFGDSGMLGCIRVQGEIQE